MAIKIVLDVNIWLSLFIKNNTEYLLDILIDNDLEIISDKNLKAEFLDVIHRKKFQKYFSDEDIKDAKLFLDSITTKFPTKKIFSGSPDKNDDYLFDLTFQSKSRILVTGDKKLLNFEIENIEIISFSDFLEKYKR